MHRNIALAVCLQHSTICQQQKLVCKLLCGSRTLRETVAQYLAGAVHVECKPTTADQMQQIEQWLAKHAYILKELLLDLPVISNDSQAALAAALQHAAAASPTCGLLLQSVSLNPTCGAVLQQLPSSHLTKLDMSLTYHPTATQAARVAAAALAGLTQLRDLSLRLSLAAWPHTRDAVQALDTALLPALSQLAQLTGLCLAGIPSKQTPLAWQHLPAQLQQLRLQADDYFATYTHLRLSHLTAVTELNTLKYGWDNDPGGGLVVTAADVLPPNTQVLAVADCECVQPLLALLQLQRLTIADSSTPPEQLQQLSSLRSLSQLKLAQNSDVDEDAATAAWSVLPLHRLTINKGMTPFSTMAMTNLGKLHTLTYLDIGVGGEVSPVLPASQFAAALRQWTGLRELRLCGAGLLQQEGDTTSMKSVVKILADLPHLISISLDSLDEWLDTAAVAELGAATQLTRLELCGNSLCDFAVIDIAYKLTGLSSLDIGTNSSISDAVLPVIARELQQLQHLHLFDTGVTDMGVVHLTRLQQLQTLCLACTRVTDAGVVQLSCLQQLHELTVPKSVSDAVHQQVLHKRACE